MFPDFTPYFSTKTYLCWFLCYDYYYTTVVVLAREQPEACSWGVSKSKSYLRRRELNQFATRTPARKLAIDFGSKLASLSPIVTRGSRL